MRCTRCSKDIDEKDYAHNVIIQSRPIVCLPCPMLTLCGDCSRTLNKWADRKTALRGQVRDFMRAADQYMPEVPWVPEEAVVKLRVKMVLEEVVEMIESCYDLEQYTTIREDLRSIQYDLECIETNVDLVDLADSLADIDYVVEGMRNSFGINGAPIADEVHRSNMAKFGPGSWKRKDGKLMKPPGWKSPNVGQMLIDQGWRPEDR